jgi:recombinational DNA repair protein RecT
MSNQPEVPQELLALVTEAKDSVYAEKLVSHYRPDFEKSLGYELMSGHLAFEPFLAAVKQDVVNSPKLGEATRRSPGSLLMALHLAAQCKLLPGSAYGLFYLIPRKMSRKTMVDGRPKWDKVPEVTPLVGYKGLCTMMQRHPRIHSVQAFCVYDGEEFDFEPGSGRLHHKWSMKVSRVDDAIVAAYAKVIITEPTSSHVVETPIVWPMTRSELMAVRERSEAYKSAETAWNGKDPSRDSPWHTDFAAMVRKSTLRAIASNGSVPRDMGLGGVLTAEAEADQVGTSDPLPVPKPTQSANIRATLGLDKAPPRFEFAEEAINAIQRAETLQQLQALASGWQHIGGIDAETIANAYENRLGDLSN